MIYYLSLLVFVIILLIKFKPFIDIFEINGKLVIVLWYSYNKERLYVYIKK